MKDLYFWIIIGIIVIQSVYISTKFRSIEKYEESILSTATYNSVDLTHVKNTTDTILGLQ